ncbi:MAG TPA: DEAD/DEAH box helicase, partial [Thermomicrobiales bacterium]|nr:DEAD/DEAH box helicase [Thermomicrobiales bacterium]
MNLTPSASRTAVALLEHSATAEDSAFSRDPSRFRDAIAQFESHYPFALDSFQREAVQTLLSGDSVMVAAPTGTGKTVVAEFGVWDVFKRTGRVIYTT